jgi:sulfide dehydrogenase cytochrome subunit
VPPPVFSGIIAMKLSVTLAASVVALASVLPAIAADAPPGASSCSGCHSPNATETSAPPRLNGRDPAKTVAALQEFRSGQRAATIMDRVVKGFTPDEIQAIATWYGAQK